MKFQITLIFWCFVSCRATFPGPIDKSLLESVSLYFYSPYLNYEQPIRSNYNLTQFIAECPTKLIIHGYLANRYHMATAPLRNAYLARGQVNVIVADWQEGSFQLYDQSRGLVPFVGERIAQILDGLFRSQAVNLDSVHVVGHSLGAHIAGNVGRYFNGRLGRISGLDPALPLFSKQSPDAIRHSDAKFVDIIHTCGSVLGEQYARGHVDFYPNSGIPSQPGCEIDDLKSLFSCSHYKAPQFFAESILYERLYPATECGLNEILQSKNDTKCVTWSNSRVVYMGEALPHTTRGTFFLQTNSVAPFGKGLSSRSLNPHIRG